MASGNGYEVAKAFVTIVPTLEGAQKSISEQLGASTDSAASEVGESSGKKLGESIASGLKTTGTVIATAMATATASAIALGKSFVDTANDVAVMGDTIAKESAKMHISTESYQELQFILSHFGSDISVVKNAMKTLTSQAESGAEAFAQLGISEEEVASLSQEDLFYRVVESLQGVTDESERTILAQSLLGKSSIDMTNLFNATAEETEALRQQVHDLGGVMSDDAVKDAEAYQDAMLNMNTALDGVKKNMMSKFLPGLTSVMDGLSLIFSGDESGIGKIQSGLQEVITNITSIAPQFFTLAQTILMSMISGFAPMLPQLVSSIFSVLIQAITTITSMIPQMMPSIISGIQGICQALFEALPVITEGLFTLIMSLVEWLSSGDNVQTFITGILQLVSLIIDQFSLLLPVLLPAIIEIIGQVCIALTEPSTIEMLINSVLQLVGAIVVALINAVPVFIEVIFGLLDNIGELLSHFLDWGGNLVANGISALMNFLSNLGNWIRNKVATIWSNLTSKFSEGINNARNIVTNGLENIKNFFSNTFEVIRNNINSKLNLIKDTFHNIFETIKNTVRDGIDRVKSFFDFDWSLPSLKMPHFNISGSFSLDPPRVPSFSVSWYAKAMEEPMILNGATIFGQRNGELLGGGEAGSEVVIGTDKLLGMMKDAVGGEQRPIVINVYGAEGQSVDALAEKISYKLEEMTRRRSAVYG